MYVEYIIVSNLLIYLFEYIIYIFVTGMEVLGNRGSRREGVLFLFNKNICNSKGS